MLRLGLKINAIKGEFAALNFCHYKQKLEFFWLILIATIITFTMIASVGKVGSKERQHPSKDNMCIIWSDLVESGRHGKYMFPVPTRSDQIYRKIGKSMVANFSQG